MFAWELNEKEYARQALKEAFDAGVGFKEFLDEVEKAVETRMGSNVGQVDEGVLKKRKRVARKLAQKVKQYFP